MATFNVVAVGTLLTEATATIYTVTSGAVFQGTLGQLCNSNTTADVTAIVEWVNTTGTVTRLASNFPVESNKSVSFVGGGLQLPGGARIQALASTTATMYITICGEEKS